jgi:hypothetical protein
MAMKMDKSTGYKAMNNNDNDMTMMHMTMRSPDNEKMEEADDMQSLLD